MRIIKRGVGKPTVANNVSVKVEKIRSDRILAALDTSNDKSKARDKPVYPNHVLEELSAAAQEALKQGNPRK